MIEHATSFLIVAALAFYAGRRTQQSNIRRAHDRGWAYGLAKGSDTANRLTDAEKRTEYRRGWQDRERADRAFRN